MKNFLVLICLLSVLVSYGQNSSVFGKVLDEENGAELLCVNVVITKNGQFQTGGTTDFEGNYSIPVAPGVYDIWISYTGYNDRVITGIPIKVGERTKLDIELNMNDPTILPVIVTNSCIPIIQQDETTTTGKVTYSYTIRHLGTKDMNAVILTTPGVSIDHL